MAKETKEVESREFVIEDAETLNLLKLKLERRGMSYEVNGSVIVVSGDAIAYVEDFLS